jgi:hypothetical protein
MEVLVRVYENGKIVREYDAWVIEDRGDFLEVKEFDDEGGFSNPPHTIAREQILEVIEGIRVDN